MSCDAARRADGPVEVVSCSGGLRVPGYAPTNIKCWGKKQKLLDLRTFKMILNAEIPAESQWRHSAHTLLYPHPHTPHPWLPEAHDVTVEQRLAEEWWRGLGWRDNLGLVLLCTKVFNGLLCVCVWACVCALMRNRSGIRRGWWESRGEGKERGRKMRERRVNEARRRLDGSRRETVFLPSAPFEPPAAARRRVRICEIFQVKHKSYRPLNIPGWMAAPAVCVWAASQETGSGQGPACEREGDWRGQQSLAVVAKYRSGREGGSPIGARDGMKLAQCVRSEKVNEFKFSEAQ